MDGVGGISASIVSRRVASPIAKHHNNNNSINNNNNHHSHTDGLGSDVPDSKLFVVGRLLAEKRENGVAYFKVRWKNYPPANDTWEPEQNLVGVADLIQEFRRAAAKSATAGGGDKNSPPSAASSSSRKRTASTRRWDVVPAHELVASKTKFFDDLEAGKIDIRSNDLYSRVKCRRRAAGVDDGSGGGGPGGGDSEDAAIYSSDTDGGGGSGAASGGGNSNHSDAGSCFAANSVGSSSTVEMDEGRPGQAATAGVSAESPSEEAANFSVKDVANNSTSSCDSSCLVSPPKSQQQQQQQSMLTDLLVSAKQLHHHLLDDCTPGPAELPPPPEPPREEPQPDSSARLVSNQVDLLRAHVAGQLARMSPSDASRLAPLAWPALCESVERGDWQAVWRTLRHQHQQQLKAAPRRLTAVELQRLLCLAAGRGHACLVDLLLSTAPDALGGQDLDVNCRGFGNAGATPLILAIEQDSLATVHRLLAAGADPNLTASGDGNSPLHRAIRGRRPHLVDALCALGGADFGSETCDGQTPLRYARRTCPQSAVVLEQYVGQLCRAMYGRVVDQLGRLGFSPAAMLLALRYVRPDRRREDGDLASDSGQLWSTTFRLPPEEAGHPGHALALVHCRQQPRSLLLVGGRRHSLLQQPHHRLHHQQQQLPPVFSDEPLGLHCWLANGPCHVTSVLLNGRPQSPLTPDGEMFLATLSGAVPGENLLQMGFQQHQQLPRLRDCCASLRIGVFALRLAETAAPPGDTPG